MEAIASRLEAIATRSKKLQVAPEKSFRQKFVGLARATPPDQTGQAELVEVGTDGRRGVSFCTRCKVRSTAFGHIPFAIALDGTTWAQSGHGPAMGHGGGEANTFLSEHGGRAPISLVRCLGIRFEPRHSIHERQSRSAESAAVVGDVLDFWTRAACHVWQGTQPRMHLRGMASFNRATDIYIYIYMCVCVSPLEPRGSLWIVFSNFAGGIAHGLDW